MVHVPTQIITPQSNKPVMGAIMDTVVGASHISMEGIELTKDELSDIYGNVDSYKGKFNLTPIREEDGEEYYSGRDVMSVVLPKINYQKGAEDSKDIVSIKKGKWLSGMAKKDVIGAASGSLIHIIANDMGVYESAKFLNEIQRVANTHLLNTGFSVSLGDCISTKKQREHIHRILNKAKAEVKSYINMTHIRAKTSKTIQLREAYENKIFSTLNKARDDAGKFAKENLSLMNGLNFMVNTGSKGNYINVCQIAAAVGQQSIADKSGQGRVPSGLENRTAPHFTKFDDGPESKGFISRSYLEGLRPHEFFFHHMAGREGLIDTAVKTSETGYIQRRLIKAMEDVKVAYDGTVRNEINTIIQFVYGTDGFDAKCSERQYISLVMGSHTEFVNRFKWKRTEFKNYLGKDVIKKMKKYSKPLDNEFKRLEMIKEFFQNKVDEDFIYIPINVHRIIDQSKKKYSIGKNDISPLEIIEARDKLLNNLRIVYDTHRLAEMMNEESLKILKYNLWCHLSSKKLIVHDKINRIAFEWIMRKVEEKFYKAVIHPGEMIGPIAAQSIGERTTQLTLNTFHSSGVSSKTKVNQGVPRLREIISATKKPKTPSMTVFLGNAKKKRDKTKEILNKIQYVPLKEFVNNVEIWYDRDPLNSVIEKDRRFIQCYYEFYDNFDLTLLSPWVLRIEIDHQILYDKQVSMFDLYKKIMGYVNKDMYHVIYSNDNSDIGKLVFHIRTIYQHTKEKKQIKIGRDAKTESDIYVTMDDLKKLKALELNMMKNLIIMGIKGVDKVYMRENKVITYKRDGTKEYKPEYVLDTVGSNLRDILNMDSIEASRTISNQIHEVHNILGIEAARNLILREINGVLKASGIYLNQKHLYLLCDIMTNKGYINTIDRHGMNKSDTGPLAKCSFEETDDQLTKAAIFSHIDSMNSIAASLIMGQMGKFGTGMVDLDMELNLE